MTPVGVFFTAFLPLGVNEQALCQQPQAEPKQGAAAPCFECFMGVAPKGGAGPGVPAGLRLGSAGRKQAFGGGCVVLRIALLGMPLGVLEGIAHGDHVSGCQQLQRIGDGVEQAGI